MSLRKGGGGGGLAQGLGGGGDKKGSVGVQCRNAESVLAQSMGLVSLVHLHSSTTPNASVDI